VRLEIVSSKLRVSVMHTSTETKDVGHRIVRSLLDNFKANGHVPWESKVKKIIFGDYDNATRVKLILSITEFISSSLLTFLDLADLSITPEADKSLPTPLAWAQNKVRDLSLTGTKLHELELLKDPANHDFILIQSVDARFQYQLKGAKGECVVTVGFPEFPKQKEKAELEISVKSVKLGESSTAIKIDVKGGILNEFNRIKFNHLQTL
jgi:hypothetical protein